MAAGAYSSEEFWWWKKAREELVMILLDKHVKTVRPTVLDIGCGDGLISKRIIDSFDADCDGVEMDRAQTAKARKNGVKIISDTIESYSGIRQYDLVLMLDVLEHLENDAAGLEKSTAMLKENGVILITVPMLKNLWSPQDETVGHKRRYEKSEIRELIERDNLEVISDGCWNSILLGPIALQKRLWRTSERKTDKSNKKRFLDRILYSILKFENMSIQAGFIPPLGVSYFAVCRKGRRI